MPADEQPKPNSRLTSWKEIAGYLGVDMRTAQRWEEDLGLPVHRETRRTRGRCFAFTAEIDAWRAALHDAPVGTLDVSEPEGPPETHLAGLEARATAFIGIGVVGVALAVFLYGWLHYAAPPELPVQMGRILVRSTSEGRSPASIQLAHLPYYMAVSPDGEKLFAVDPHGRKLSIITTATRAVRTLTVPIDIGPIALSFKGRLYIGSSAEGIVVVDTAKERLLGGTIPTGGPVQDMALTPDGKKLFLAMEHQGLKRLSTETQRIDQVSDRICPEHLGMDPLGKNLYVAYQCSGPGGQPGHDSVEVFDADKEVIAGVISGPPMVGGPVWVSPDGKLVLLDGKDACSDERYDHSECPSDPSHVTHLVRASDRRIVKTFGFQRAGPVGFLDNRKFLVKGRSVFTVDAASYMKLEEWDDENSWQSVVFDLPRRRVYLGSETNHKIFALDAEAPECLPPSSGLAMFYPGDGTMEDAAGTTILERHGKVGFVPGRVGQAFFLDGASYLFESWTSSYSFLHQDSSLALYVKLASSEGEMSLVDWTSDSPQAGIRLLKSADNHLVFQSWPGGGVVTSKSAVKPNVWYHVTVTKTDQEVVLYINGELEGRGGAPARYYDDVRPLLLGARNPGQPAFHGWLDEIAFYGRALSGAEVRAMYQTREVGPCRLP